MVIAISSTNHDVMGFESVQSYKEWATEAVNNGQNPDDFIVNTIHEIEPNQICNEHNAIDEMHDFHCSLYD